MLKKIKKSHRYLKPAVIIAVLTVFVMSLLLFIYKPKARAQIFLTSGTTWTVPSDWSNSNNTIEVIGGGGGAGAGFSDSSGSGGEGGGGGGGGAYSKATNVTLSPGSTVSISIGVAGSGGASSGNSGSAGGDTYLCNSINNCGSIAGSAVVVGAKGGSGGVAGASAVPGAGGAGGVAASGIGSTKFGGGAGGTGAATGGGSGGGGGGGGGAAGPNTVGGGGSNGTVTPGGSGGQGDGTFGGGGGGSNGGSGGNGTEYDATHGSGGGGGGGNGISRGSGTAGGPGGQYGGAGGGGGGNGSKQGSGGAGADGKQGMIRIIYNFTVENDYRWRADDGSESAGSALAAQNTAATINYGSNVRLRLSITNLGDNTTFSYRLEYAPYVGSCGAWTAIPNTATTEHFNMYNSSNYTDQTSSTNVSTGPGVLTDPAGYSFASGKLVESPSNTATNQTLSANTFTELEFAIQPNSNATYGSYCFRLTTSAGTPLDSYQHYPILNINYPPSTPTIYSVTNSSTNVPRIPQFSLKSSDNNSDYLAYDVEVCPTNSWPCGAGGHVYDQTSASTCWYNQDANSGAAYVGSPQVVSSSLANCEPPETDQLLANTTYFIRARAIDPGGSNTWSAYSSVNSFTTASLQIRINGGTCIGGVGSSCSSGSGGPTDVKIGG